MNGGNRALWLAALLWLTASLAAGQKQALVLYDGTSQKVHEGIVDGIYIANLLGHFAYHPTLQPSEEYRRGGMDKYDAVFVVGASPKTVWPAALLRDARARNRMLAWIGYGMDSFLGGNEDKKLGLRLESVQLNSRFRQVLYRGTVLGKGSGTIVLLSITNPSRVKVDAEAVDPDGNRTPYMLHVGQLWLVADVPFAYIDERDRYLAFCDLMHDMLGVDHAISRRAMIRLEDVTADDDPDEVRRAVDVFVHEGVPFQIALVPLFVDPGARREVHLSEQPEMIKVLHYAVAHGATIVLHGYTHQYRGVSADDFEFWDGFRNAPRADDSAELVQDKLDAALDECFRSDLYPVAWETPHYEASPVDYTEFGKVFSTFNEQIAIDGLGTQQGFPYPTVDIRGLRVVPENIGYLPEGNPQPSELIQNARMMMVVRDGIASAFVHDFLDPRLIQQTIRGIKQLGYRFISLKEFDSRVANDDHLIAIGETSRSITLRDAYLHQFLLEPDGSHRQETWSDTRYTGTMQASLKPGPGEILVAGGMDERPAPPVGYWGRLTQGVSAMAKRWRPKAANSTEPRPMKAAIVWMPDAVGVDGNDQESFANAFRAFGVSPRLISIADLRNSALDKDEILVVPHGAAAALTPNDDSQIAQFVRQGGQLMLDGRSRLAEWVGVRYPGGAVEIDKVTDTAQMDLMLNWKPLTVMDRFHVPDRATVLGYDVDSHAAVEVAYPVGSGKVLYLGVILDPYTPDGTSHYPFLFEHALSVFDRMMPARRRTTELYFDPSYRTEVSIEDVAVLWRRMGVRVVYAAAWVVTSRFSYDYERLIRICHANGILVYAWFEFPQVSWLFWDQHPEWREVPAAGEKLPSWRKAMNFENPECRAAALQYMTSLLDRWPWDGVNLAELNYDGIADGDKPGRMEPLNDNVRQGFRARYHFDPRDLFNPRSGHYWKRDKAGWKNFLAYRRDLVTQLHRDFLNELKPFAASGREVIVTMFDSLEHPEVTPNTGLDANAIIGLVHDYTFTVQVEDPATAWKNPPSRYLQMAQRYRSILPPGARFMIDVNVIGDRDIANTHLPCAAAVGTELAATVRAARSASDRFGLYGDATVRSFDLEMLSYAAADRANVRNEGTSWAVDSPDPIELRTAPGIHSFYLDGRDWPYWRPGSVLLPPGRYTVTTARWWSRWFDISELEPELVDIGAPLLSASTQAGGLQFEYDSLAPAYACLRRTPSGGATVDGKPVEVLAGAGEIGAVLVLPAGRHRVHVARSTGLELVLDSFSLLSSSLIVAFGSGSVLVLGMLYIGIRVRRLFNGRGGSWK
jgi:hypothetical protein